MNEFEMMRKVRCHNGPVEKMRPCSSGVGLEEHVELCCTCVPLMKTKVAPELEADQRSKRKAYRRAQARAGAATRRNGFAVDASWLARRDS
jgi:hypothetical protein